MTGNIPLIAFEVLDHNYLFRNFFYSVFAYMDTFFEYMDPGFGREIMRKLLDPLKELFSQKVTKGEVELEMNERLFKFFSAE